MNVQQRIAAIAVLIGLAGTAGIAHYTNATVNGNQRAVQATASIALPSGFDGTTAPGRADSAAAPGSASTLAIPTLPTIIVHPSPEVLRQLRSEGRSAAVGLQMPWYSFSSDAAGA